MKDATTLLEAAPSSLAHSARYNPGNVVAPVIYMQEVSRVRIGGGRRS